MSALNYVPLNVRLERLQTRLALAFVIILVLLIGLVSAYGNKIDGIREVSCRAPQDTSQKLTVRLVNVDGVLVEECQYSALGFGRTN